MTVYERVREDLRESPRRWVVTGVAGFIGSHLLAELLRLGQHVVGVDNFATGYPANVEAATEEGLGRGTFRMVRGDVADLSVCRDACEGSEIVLHQAALGSVPRSLHDPIETNRANVDGVLNMLVAARDVGVSRFVYAGSSSTYGAEATLPKREDRIGAPLSPYAVTKYVNELYAGVFQLSYGLQTIGLRYFNVFGPRQDPNGAYAAVIPKWVANLLAGRPCEIYGDGETSRDFTYVSNVVQANLLAALAPEDATGEVYNVACGESVTLNRLFAEIRQRLATVLPTVRHVEPIHSSFRPGDVRHSLADVEKISSRLGYEPTHLFAAGLDEAIGWYVRNAQGLVAERVTG